MSRRAKVAVIGTGGTISSVGRGPFDLQNYLTLGRMLDARGMIEAFPQAAEFADLVPVPFPPVPSTNMTFSSWVRLHEIIDGLVAAHTDLSGIVILHGTASMEESAYALDLTLRTDVPVVFTGAQRPSTGLSTDAAMNLANAVRVAASTEARGLGVLVVLNDEIHAAREVTKTATWRLQTFRTPDFGALGHADADRIAIYRRPARRHAPNGPFSIDDLRSPARVDISYCYAGVDGTAVRAFVAAGARGIVSAGFAPGMVSPAELDALREAVAAGLVVVQSSRGGSGRVPTTERIAEAGMIGADNLNPQKARIFLSLALNRTRDVAAIRELFETC
ncbi:MAG: asparaginase [Betaproteobacteria bacterium]|nr:asparaginase [Betaproteobacteria bacterium]